MHRFVIIVDFYLDSPFPVFVDIVILLIDETSFNLKLHWMWNRRRRVQGKGEEEREGVQ